MDEDNSELNPDVVNRVKDTLTALPKIISDNIPVLAEISAGWDRVKQERFATAIQQLEENEIELEDVPWEVEDRIHAIQVTFEAIRRTRKRDKIRFLANLLAGQLSEEEAVDDVSEYEEYVQILDELSYRELTLLYMMDKHGLHMPEGRNELSETQSIDEGWSDFVEEAKATFDLEENELTSILHRLTRSGCFQETIGYDSVSIRGLLTPVWSKLKERTEIEIED